MEIKFIADEMNGDLARWLRILGYDCLYQTGKTNLDEDIVKLAVEEGRVVLTADEELFRRCLKRGVKVVYTPMGKIEEKLGYLIARLDLKTDFALQPRCTVCNAKLSSIEAEELRGKVDDQIIKRHSRFWICSKCGKIYWEGSHWRRIKDTARRSAEISGRFRDKMGN